jgi:hypothetical protein
VDRTTQRRPIARPALEPIAPQATPLFQAANSAYHTTSKRELALFYHAVAGYPVPSTWIKAIQAGNYTTWPSLTATLITKHLPNRQPP